MVKKFEFETVIKEAENICNMDEIRGKILELVFDGKKILFYGRRNTGKTSLIESCIIPEWLRQNKNGIYLFVDMYGVRSLSNVSERFSRSFSEAFARSNQTKRLIQSLLKIVASLRPKISLDPTGNPQIELVGAPNENTIHFEEIFKKLNEIKQKKIPVLVVMDEFQDVQGIEQAEGLLRGAFQHLEADIPIIILGSKKHMLSKIFSIPEKPFYNWGESVEVTPIAYEEYTEFMKDRDLNIPNDVSEYLQNKMKRIPEPINITCYYLSKKKGNRKIRTKDVDEVITDIVENRRGRPQQYLSTLTANQARFLEVLSHQKIIKKITSKEVQKATFLSSSGILKVVAFLENQGTIYRSEAGYELTDPFLELHLKKYGI